MCLCIVLVSACFVASFSQTLVTQSCPTLCDSMDYSPQVPLSMEFSRQEFWSGLPFPSPGHLLSPGIEPGLLHCRQILYCLSHKGSLFHDSDLSIFLLQILITTLGPPREFRIISISKSLTRSYLESSFVLCKVTY